MKQQQQNFVVKYLLPGSVIDKIAWLAHDQQCSDQNIVQRAIEAYDPPRRIVPESNEPPMQTGHFISDRMAAILTQFNPNRII